MKNTIKVEHTREVKTSYGNYVPCAMGKLVLIKSVGKPDGNVYIDSIGYKSIVISETEEIEATIDNPVWVYDCRKDMDGFIHEITCSLDKSEPVYKILALPEHFSLKQSQVIVDGKLKDGDDLFVECEKSAPPKDEYEDHSPYYIKRNNKNHITTHPVDDKALLEELAGFFYHLGAADGIACSLKGATVPFKKRYEEFCANEKNKNEMLNLLKKQ